MSLIFDKWFRNFAKYVSILGESIGFVLWLMEKKNFGYKALQKILLYEIFAKFQTFQTFDKRN
jgi:hypothetical protein